MSNSRAACAGAPKTTGAKSRSRELERLAQHRFQLADLLLTEDLLNFRPRFGLQLVHPLTELFRLGTRTRTPEYFPTLFGDLVDQSLQFSFLLFTQSQFFRNIVAQKHFHPYPKRPLKLKFFEPLHLRFGEDRLDILLPFGLNLRHRCPDLFLALVLG